MDPQAFIYLGSRKGQSSDLEADENKAGRRLCHHCSCSLSMRLHSQSAKDEMENLGLVFGIGTSMVTHCRTTRFVLPSMRYTIP